MQISESTLYRSVLAQHREIAQQTWIILCCRVDELSVLQIFLDTDRPPSALSQSIRLNVIPGSCFHTHKRISFFQIESEMNANGGLAVWAFDLAGDLCNWGSKRVTNVAAAVDWLKWLHGELDSKIITQHLQHEVTN